MRSVNASKSNGVVWAKAIWVKLVLESKAAATAALMNVRRWSRETTEGCMQGDARVYSDIQQQIPTHLGREGSRMGAMHSANGSRLDLASYGFPPQSRIQNERRSRPPADPHRSDPSRPRCHSLGRGAARHPHPLS